MHKFCVARIQGKQVFLTEGQEIKVDKIDGKKGDSIVFEEILLMAEGGETMVGAPVVDKAKVKATILGQLRGDKVRVATYKAKARYRKVKGFRAELTHIKIEKIISPAIPRKPSAKKATPKKPVAKKAKK